MNQIKGRDNRLSLKCPGYPGAFLLLIVETALTVQ